MHGLAELYFSPIMYFLLIVFYCQVFAYALESKSMIMHGLDELGNPTVGTFSITEKNEVMKC